MIDMINYSRVFRYLLKPVEPEALRLTINAAVAHHHYLRSNPELAKRQEVVNQTGKAEGSETLNQFFSRVRDMQGRGYGPTGS
jgi:response regulator of citrate/malate metabolism